MSAIPADIDTARQPPMTIPLRHFVVALGLLAAAVGLRVGLAVGVAPGAARLAHVHLLVAGWVCVTIMGAMTQFVPVWSGVDLYSRRLATTQLWAVGVGLVGLAGCFLLGAFAWLPVFGAAALLGFWTFAYNMARTLSRLDGFDVTERHFGLAIGFLVAVTGLGFLLAVDFTRPLFAGVGATHGTVRAAHVTLAVFGVVVTTVVGALYQLATMFTQTKLRGVDVWLRRVEEVGYPLGVVALAGGRLVSEPTLARVGGALVALSLLGVAAILARRLVESSVDWTPMLTRYAVAAVALAAWAVLTVPAWVAAPLAGDRLFGTPGVDSLFLLGFVGFVVLGTLYHVVPFIVWVHRYSDRLGLEPVPMLDDLYSDRLARLDFALVLSGVAVVVTNDLAGLSPAAETAGWTLVFVGVAAFAANLLRVIWLHSPQSLVGGAVASAADADDGAD
ncbi:hypothetical protein C5C07_13540 [Haloferax sp. Atlit-4N]|uniref:Cytochrome C oxidase subunit I n=1 Tax=Haloferax gibbonsii (strain ATCC 33959 / DSM 4427 / JCM 8863 / NBRC 102184 / NCIMB 2188 / Ma 2.38) TaxID=1227459 RepID=M0HA80_HALGM|nr:MULTISPECIES: hypothetical protein [Haloferax]ELZ80009.1 hypothetical protein C454_12433 [Haloferax gibbonsii ATCC 33959]RDZ52780.1 hypothetical protein C5C07_13540 [Haloferax sp. Atlit-4N]